MSGNDGSRAASQSYASRMTAPTVATTRLATTARNTGGGGLRACRTRMSTHDRGCGSGAGSSRWSSVTDALLSLVSQEREHRAPRQGLGGVAGEHRHTRDEAVQLVLAQPRANTRAQQVASLVDIDDRMAAAAKLGCCV